MAIAKADSVSSSSVESYASWRRWTIYIIGVIETFTFGACIFGWAALVYVLKNERVFYDLCEHSDLQDIYVGCEAQDLRFARVFTISYICYSSPAFLIGFLLHYWGLAVSRIMAASMITLGFICLSFTTQENTHWLYIAMILIPTGGNQLRLSVLQLCNVFPRYRSTALTVISGSFAASAGLFVIFQLGQDCGLKLSTMSICLAGFASLSLPATVLMPRHEVPYQRPGKDNPDSKSIRDGIPLRESLLSISSFMHMFWMSFNVTVVSYFAVSFNSWITEIAETKEEAGRYSLIYSMSSFVCPLVSPLPGLVTDFINKRGKGKSNEEKFYKELASPVLPLVVVTLISIVLQSCLFFHDYVAIYVALIAMVILRPSIMAVGTDFLRIRFPNYHFSRLIGIYGTACSMVGAIQYPLFWWAQNDFVAAMSCFISVICLSLVHPLHLMSKHYRKKITFRYFEDLPLEQNTLIRF